MRAEAAWRAVALFGGLFVLLVVVTGFGWLRPLDASISRAAHDTLPCWSLTGSQVASLLLAGEVSLVYAGLIALLCAWRGRPMVGVWIVGLLLATVAVEFSFKLLFDQPAPRTALGGLARPDCARVAYPLTGISTEVVPNSLPSGYSIRAAYFAVLLAALVGVRWPRLAGSTLYGLAAVALILGATRVAIAWHWATDVVAGLLLGAAAAYLALAIADGFCWLSRTTRGRTGEGGSASLDGAASPTPRPRSGAPARD